MFTQRPEDYYIPGMQCTSHGIVEERYGNPEWHSKFVENRMMTQPSMMIKIMCRTGNHYLKKNKVNKNSKQLNYRLYNMTGRADIMCEMITGTISTMSVWSRNFCIVKKYMISGTH